MKPEPASLTREKKQRQKNDAIMSENCDVIVVFGFLANLEQSGGRIPETESTKAMFSLIIIFFLIKTENRTKKYLAHL